jgi:hypothetical protein
MTLTWPCRSARKLEADDHGLLGWCFDGLGSQISPFKDLRDNYPAVWEICQQSYRQP